MLCGETLSNWIYSFVAASPQLVTVCIHPSPPIPFSLSLSLSLIRGLLNVWARAQMTIPNISRSNAQWKWNYFEHEFDINPDWNRRWVEYTHLQQVGQSHKFEYSSFMWGSRDIRRHTKTKSNVFREFTLNLPSLSLCLSLPLPLFLCRSCLIQLCREADYIPELTFDKTIECSRVWRQQDLVGLVSSLQHCCQNRIQNE